MTWVRLDDEFYEHDKIIALSDAAFRLWANALGFCNRKLTDGFLQANAVGLLTTHRNPRTLVAELVTQWLWEPVSGGYLVHDYLKYQPTKAKVLHDREQNAKRQA